MRILVCIRQGLDGEINPFDACAYEEALKIKNAEVILISMGPEKTKDFLLNLTRLGAKKAILLSDKVFAGADTIATAYTLSLAVKLIKPDLIFCGRQTLVGDTAQTGPMLSVYSNYSLISNVMNIEKLTNDSITCTTRNFGEKTVNFPALLTFERINNLRLPSIFSKISEVEVWDSIKINADASKCGLEGSPTRVLKTFENNLGKRKCTFISLSELNNIIENNVDSKINVNDDENTSVKLSKVCIIGSEPSDYAKSISDDYIAFQNNDVDKVVDFITNNEPNAVLFASDDESKELAAKVAAKLDLGLCADCTKLESDGEQLIMYRPALSGSIVAKIISKTKPALATVRTKTDSSNIVVAAGWGSKDNLEKIKEFANNINASLVATRKMVDNDYLPYSMQVGLTGKTIAPKIYIAIGVSGAIHHIVGMQRSDIIIAINSDKDAPIFDYADYGIIADINEINL